MTLINNIVLQDLSLVPECERIVADAAQSLGGLDVVIHNAVCYL